MELVNATRKAIDSGPRAAPTRRSARPPRRSRSCCRWSRRTPPRRCGSGWATQPSVALAGWPAVDPALLVEETVTCVVQVAGKVRDRLEVAAATSARTSCASWRWPRRRWQRALDGARRPHRRRPRAQAGQRRAGLIPSPVGGPRTRDGGSTSCGVTRERCIGRSLGSLRRHGFACRGRHRLHGVPARGPGGRGTASPSSRCTSWWTGSRSTRASTSTSAEVAEALRARRPVTTSRPSPQAFVEMYRGCRRPVPTRWSSVHLSGEMSGHRRRRAARRAEVAGLSGRRRGLAVARHGPRVRRPRGGAAAAAGRSADRGRGARARGVALASSAVRCTWTPSSTCAAAGGSARRRPARVGAGGEAAAPPGRRPDRAAGAGPDGLAGAGPAGRDRSRRRPGTAAVDVAVHHLAAAESRGTGSPSGCAQRVAEHPPADGRRGRRRRRGARRAGHARRRGLAGECDR